MMNINVAELTKNIHVLNYNQLRYNDQKVRSIQLSFKGQNLAIETFFMQRADIDPNYERKFAYIR